MQHMTYEEREYLKHNITALGDQAGEALRMITHWHRQSVPVPFTLYAANWAAARKGVDVSKLRELWPLKGERVLEDGYTDWIEPEGGMRSDGVIKDLQIQIRLLAIAAAGFAANLIEKRCNEDAGICVSDIVEGEREELMLRWEFRFGADDNEPPELDEMVDELRRALLAECADMINQEVEAEHAHVRRLIGQLLPMLAPSRDNVQTAFEESLIRRARDLVPRIVAAHPPRQGVAESQ